MADHPLLFRLEMVRALLEGRKTQTRRPAWLESRNPTTFRIKDSYERPTAAQRIEPDDLIWVREGCHNAVAGQTWMRRWLRDADDSPCVTISDRDDAGRRSPVHMPRRDSRLTLAVTAVRIERLLAISKADAIAEGCPGVLGPNPDFPDEWDPSPQEEYLGVYASIHGAKAPLANPEVVVITFRVHRDNIDAFKAGKVAA